MFSPWLAHSLRRNPTTDLQILLHSLRENCMNDISPDFFGYIHKCFGVLSNRSEGLCVISFLQFINVSIEGGKKSQQVVGRPVGEQNSPYRQSTVSALIGQTKRDLICNVGCRADQGSISGLAKCCIVEAFAVPSQSQLNQLTIGWTKINRTFQFQ